MSKIGFATKSFYGSTKKEYLRLQEKKRKRLEQEKKFKDRPLPSIKFYETCFSERKVWKQFHRQQEALDYSKNVKEKAACLFAFEKLDGKRSYLVTTRKQFWVKYQSLAESKQHFYEVIPETSPCRLYFDIEYKIQCNPTLNGSAAVQIFIAYVCYCIYKEFNIDCSERNVINLTSTTDKKFSRHLIFNHPDLLFVNNIHCGDFVKEICFSLRSFLLTGVHNKYLPVETDYANEKQTFEIAMKDLIDIMVYNEKNEQVFLCDLCVYTKNRNFRLYKSSKMSKNVPLVISEDNKFKFKSKPEGKEKFLRYQMKNEKFDADFEKFSNTLVCPYETNSKKVLEYGSAPRSNSVQASVKSSNVKTNQVESGTKSLFPELDEFILKVVDRHGPKGHVRRWIYHKEREMIVYDIGENRWCGNIKRQHKSNHVYYVADLRLSQVHQKCHDFECSSYRSEGTSISPEINPLFNGNDTMVVDGFDDANKDQSLMAMFDEDIEVIGKESQVAQKQSFDENKCQNLSEFFDSDNEIDSEILQLPHRMTECTKGGIHEDYPSICDSDDDIFLDKSLPLVHPHCDDKDSMKSNNSFDLFESSERSTLNICQQSNNCINSFCSTSSRSFSAVSPGDQDLQDYNNTEQKPNKKTKLDNNAKCTVSMLSASQESQLNEIFNDDFIFDEV